MVLHWGARRRTAKADHCEEAQPKPQSLHAARAKRPRPRRPQAICDQSAGGRRAGTEERKNRASSVVLVRSAPCSARTKRVSSWLARGCGLPAGTLDPRAQGTLAAWRSPPMVKNHRRGPPAACAPASGFGRQTDPAGPEAHQTSVQNAHAPQLGEQNAVQRCTVSIRPPSSQEPSRHPTDDLMTPRQSRVALRSSC